MCVDATKSKSVDRRPACAAYWGLNPGASFTGNMEWAVGDLVAGIIAVERRRNYLVGER